MKKCTKIKQLVKTFCLVAFGVISVGTNCLEINKLERSPANFVPSEELEPVPFQQTIWLDRVLVEDDRGVLSGMTNTLNEWQEEEEYARNWNLVSTNMYDIKDESDRKSFVARQALKYVDKRISGEVKRADEGSTLYRVGQAQKALKPKAEAKISENFKVKVKGRVLKGKVIVKLVNPYVDCHVDVHLDGRINMEVKKELKDLQVVAKTTYEVKEGRWIASIDKKLTQSISTRLSSTQSSKGVVFGDNADNRLEVFYSNSF